MVVNYYNPCLRIESSKLEDIDGTDRASIVWCGDFNAHNTLCGSGIADSNDQPQKKYWMKGILSAEIMEVKQ